MNPSEIYEKQVREAAEQVAQYCYCAGGVCSGCETNTIKLFYKGAEWATKHPAPHIQKLLEALRFYGYGWGEDMPKEIVGMKHDEFGLRARTALQEYERAVKNE